MSYRLVYSVLATVVLGGGALSTGVIAAEDGVTEDATEKTGGDKATREEGPDEVDFPSELLLDPDRMPEPVRKTILQRIDEHERLERLLLDRPIEIREQGSEE